jgi:hypothetical protein
MPLVDFHAKINDHGIPCGNTGQILAWLQHPGASTVALDLLCWAIHQELHNYISRSPRPAKQPAKEMHFFDNVNFVIINNRT